MRLRPWRGGRIAGRRWVPRALAAGGLLVVAFGQADFISEPLASAEQPEDARTPEQELTALVVEYTLLYQQQEYVRATELAERALEQAERVLTEDDPYLAQILNDLGKLYQVQGDHTRAEPLHQRALAIREQLFESDGLEVAQSLKNLANTYHAQQRDTEAAPLLGRVVGILERTLPPSHPQLDDTLELYAAVLRGAGQAEQATAVEERLEQQRTGEHPTSPDANGTPEPAPVTPGSAPEYP